MKQKRVWLWLLVFSLIFIFVGCKREEEPISDFNALGNWENGSGEVYTIKSNTTEKLAFDYQKGNLPDAYLQSSEIKTDLSVYKKLVITVQGTGSILVRLETKDANSKKEVSLNVTGIKGTYEWNILDSSNFLKNVNRIKIIAAPGKEDSNGNVEITELIFSDQSAEGFIIQDNYNNIPSNVNEYNGTDVNFDFNAKWSNFKEEAYQITYEGTTAKVNFKKEAGQEWAVMQSLIKGDFSKFNYVVVVAKGTKGQGLIVKAMDGYETKVILTGEEQTIVVDISNMTTEKKNAIPSILIFGMPGAAGSGQFEIIQGYMTAEYEIDKVEIIKNEYNGTDKTFAIENWYDNGDKAYTITKDGTDEIITYDKITGMHDWAFAASYLTGDISGFEKIEIVVTGAAGKKAMFKIEGAGQNVEKPVQFDGTKQTIVMDITSMSKEALQAVDKVLLFAAPGGAGKGSLTIHSVTFMVNEYSFVEGWVADDVYNFTTNADGSVTVTYNKTSGESWAFTKQEFGKEASEFNTLKLILRGTAGKKVLVKPNDNNTLEQWITFVEGEDAIVEVTAEQFISIILFAEPELEVEGSFTIVSATLRYVKPEVEPSILPDVDVNSGWVDNGDGVYTITEGENGVEVAYDKKALEWPTAKLVLPEDKLGYNNLTIVLKGTPEKQVLVKVNGTKEVWVSFDAEGNGVAVADFDNITDILLFAEGGTANVTGSFTIVSAKLYYTTAE